MKDFSVTPDLSTMHEELIMKPKERNTQIALSAGLANSEMIVIPGNGMVAVSIDGGKTWQTIE